MYCRSRPQYRSDLGWISGVAFLGTLTRSARPVQGFTCVRCCSMPPASSPHGLAAPGLGRLTTAIPALHAVAFSSRLLPTRSAEDFHLQSSAHAWHTKSKSLRDGLRPPLTVTARSALQREVGLGRGQGDETVKTSLDRRHTSAKPSKRRELPLPISDLINRAVEDGFDVDRERHPIQFPPSPGRHPRALSK